MLDTVEKLIFVVGCQRSGTTLLGQILGASPQALLIDEEDGLYQWFDELSEDVAASNMFPELLERARNKYREPATRVGLNEHNRPYLMSHIRFLVLKAPNLTYAYKKIAKLNVSTAVAYIVRDPRSVVASMLALHHIPMIENQRKLLVRHECLAAEFATEIEQMADRSVSQIVKSALIWRIKSSLQHRFAAESIPTHTIMYEDLIADTMRVCMETTACLGVPFHSAMLVHEKIFQGLGPGRTDRSRAVDKLSVDAWENSFDEIQEQQVLAVASQTMKALGYPLKGKRVSKSG